MAVFLPRYHSPPFSPSVTPPPKNRRRTFPKNIPVERSQMNTAHAQKKEISVRPNTKMSITADPRQPDSKKTKSRLAVRSVIWGAFYRRAGDLGNVPRTAANRGDLRRAVVCSSSSSWHSAFGVMLLTRSWALGKGPVRSV